MMELLFPYLLSNIYIYIYIYRLQYSEIVIRVTLVFNGLSRFYLLLNDTLIN